MGDGPNGGENPASENDVLSKRTDRRGFLGWAARTGAKVVATLFVAKVSSGCAPNTPEPTPTRLPTYPTMTPKEVDPVITKDDLMEKAIADRLKETRVSLENNFYYGNLNIHALNRYETYKVITPDGSLIRSSPDDKTNKDDLNTSVVGSLEWGANLRASYEMTYDEVDKDGKLIRKLKYLVIKLPDLQEYSSERDHFSFKKGAPAGIDVFKEEYFFVCREITQDGVMRTFIDQIN